MVKYLARNIVVVWFFLGLFILIDMPGAYNKAGGILIAILMIAYANAVLFLDKQGI